MENNTQAFIGINDKNSDTIGGENFDGRKRLSGWLNKEMKIEMTDGRIIIGDFVCTDRNANIILSSSVETYNTEKTGIKDVPRTLGLVMIPGRHVVTMCHDKNRGSFRKF